MQIIVIRSVLLRGLDGQQITRQIGVKISIIMIFFTKKYLFMHFWFEIPFFFGVYIFILSSSFQGDKFSPFSPLKDRKAIIVVASVLEHFVDQEAEAESF